MHFARTNVMERVCLIAILMNAVAAQYSDPMSGILDGLVAHASLTPTERLATIGAGWMQPWLYSNQYSSINSMKSWSQPLRSPSTMYTFSDVYSWLFHQALAIRPLETNCYLSAFGAWDTYFNTSTRRDILYYLSLDVPTWMQNYDDGQYRETVSISFNYKADDGSVGEIQYTADSIVRVDIQPREWYTRALPWILRNSRMTENGVCGSNVTRVYDCFFDEKKGCLTASTTGMLVASNVQILSKVRWPNGSHSNATIRSKPDYPNIVAWVIERMPVRDSFCPCYEPNPARRPTQFCTYLDPK